MWNANTRTPQNNEVYLESEEYNDRNQITVTTLSNPHYSMHLLVSRIMLINTPIQII